MKQESAFSEVFYQSGQIPEKVAGAQIIGRVFQVMRLLGEAGGEGARLKDLATATGVSRPTVHRILHALVIERAVVQDPETRRYLLGPLAFELGLAAPHYAHLVETCRPELERLAHTTGDSVFLTARSGFDAVCIGRVDGAFPIATLPLNAGGRRPLGIGSAGLALLAGLEDGHLEMCLEQRAAAYGQYNGMTAQRLRDDALAARASGFGVSRETTTLGVSAVSAVVPSQLGAPYLAVSVAAVTPRIFGGRFEWICSQLKRAASQIAEAIGGR